MHSLFRRALVVAIVLASGGHAIGANCASRSALTIPELVATALADNKDLQAARYSVEISRARLSQAGLRSNPRLELGARSDVLFGNDGEYEASIGLSQDFPISGRLLRQKEVARIDVVLAELEIAEAERQQANRVASSAIRLGVIDRRIVILDRIVAAERELAEVAARRLKSAEVSEMDVNTVRIDLQRHGQERSTLAIERQSLLSTLNGLLGRPANQTLQVLAPAHPVEALASLASLQDEAFRRRPDWQAAAMAVDRAGAQLALARSQRWEDWNVTVGLAQDRQVITGAPPQDAGRSLGVSVSIPLPLYDKGQGRMAESRASGDQARASLEARRLEIANEVAAAYEQVHLLQDALAQAKPGASSLADRNVELARLGYRMALLPIFEVVQAQRQQAEASARYLDLLEQTLQAQVRLHTAVGDRFAADSTASPSEER